VPNKFPCQSDAGCAGADDAHFSPDDRATRQGPTVNVHF
jgi:hypothetical protein